MGELWDVRAITGPTYPWRDTLPGAAIMFYDLALQAWDIVMVIFRTVVRRTSMCRLNTVFLSQTSGQP